MKAAEASDPSARLREEVLAEGRRMAEAIRDGARREGEAILDRASARVDALKAEAQAAALRKAGTLRERILAGVPMEVARRRAARAESLLDSLRERARRALSARAGFDDREAVVALAAEALDHMPGEAFRLAIAPGDLARMGPGLAEAIRIRARRPGLRLDLAEDPAIPAGFVLQDEAGREAWDDRLPERLERLWPRLRIPAARAAGLLPEEGGGP